MESARGHAQPSVLTDDQGRYCFKWPDERIVPSVAVARPLPHSTLPPDPRFTDPRVLDSRFAAPQEVVDRSPPYHRTTAPVVISVGHGYLAATDPHAVFVTATDLLTDDRSKPANCPRSRVQPPWWRVDDASKNWRSILIYLSAALAVAFVVASRRTITRRWGYASMASAALIVEAGLLVVIWNHVL